jgi:hypothetical protein
MLNAGVDTRRKSAATAAERTWTFMTGLWIHNAMGDVD